jgi:NhaA family Na+:H+ antiporter
VLLLVCAVVAVVWANSPWSEAYFGLWSTKLTLSLGAFSLGKPLLLWINDGLMAIFFFVVGLEIKREILVGELSKPRQAALPIAAAIGGMAVPALIYAAFNQGTEGIRGWGIPMATDIAFALGVLALLGDRVPASAKVFLTAVAIVDDIGATLVIAIFYTEQLSLMALALGGLFLLLMIFLNWAGFRSALLYGLLGLCLWVAMLKSGIHPTLAGVLGAMTIPARTRIDGVDFVHAGRRFVEGFAAAGATGRSILTNARQRAMIQALEDSCHHAQTPLQRLEHSLHPWVSFIVMPVFALANAGVVIDSTLLPNLVEPVALGIVLGLVVGKQVGVLGFAWVAVKLRMADLPNGLRWRHVYGLGWLAGIGFTMALFIAGLAFAGSESHDVSKAGILCGSLIAGVGGWLVMRRVGPQRRPGQ